MCKPAENILFCTCGDLEQINPKVAFPKRKFKRDFYENEYLEVRTTWDLSHFCGHQGSGMVGMMIMPSKELKSGITEAYILNLLNSTKKAFDFDYSPQEEDQLKLRTEYIYCNFNKRYRPDSREYLTFIYNKGTWNADWHNAFSTKIEEFAHGIINQNFKKED